MSKKRRYPTWDIDVRGSSNISRAVYNVKKNKLMLEFHSGDWIPPLYRTIAIQGDGVTELVVGLKKHRDYLMSNGLIEEKRGDRQEFALRELMKSHLNKHLDSLMKNSKESKTLFQRVRNKEISPYEAATQLYDLLMSNN